jgi:hypothetical protein
MGSSPATIVGLRRAYTTRMGEGATGEKIATNDSPTMPGKRCLHELPMGSSAFGEGHGGGSGGYRTNILEGQRRRQENAFP